MNRTNDLYKSLLFADGQHPDMAGKLDVFAPLIGAWDLTWTGFSPDGSTQSECGEWFFFWALEGRMVQDLWIIPGLQNRGRAGFPEGEYGTTLRYYDQKRDCLRASWFGPINNSFPTFTIRKTDEEVILESEPDAAQRKWIFSEICQDSFRWRSERLREGTWVLEEEMRVVRRPALAPAVIERIWHGWASLENAADYEALLREEIFAGIANRNIPGYRGIRLLTRSHATEVEFITIMRFDSFDAVRAFAGEDYERSVVPEKARKLLSRFDERATHYQIKEERVG